MAGEARELLVPLEQPALGRGGGRGRLVRTRGVGHDHRALRAEALEAQTVLGSLKRRAHDECVVTLLGEDDALALLPDEVLPLLSDEVLPFPSDEERSDDDAAVPLLSDDEVVGVVVCVVVDT